MTIRAKIVAVVLPLVMTPLVLTGVISALSARSGLTNLAAGLLQFKAEQLLAYAAGQQDLLVSNGLEGSPSYVEASRAAVEGFARGLLRSPTELIFAIGPDGNVVIRSADLRATPAELSALRKLASGGTDGWQTIRVGGTARVAEVAAFDPLRWTVFVSESEDAFYQSANDILVRAAIILGVSLAAAALLLGLFSSYLTRPLAQVATAMENVIATGEFSRRVDVLFDDETGRLGHTFNLMSEELGTAYTQIKGYALRAAMAQVKEEKTRHIFQKYVPKSVLESFFAHPEQALVGEDRMLAVLFSDVRGFTGISERMLPEELVESLNQYFARMVEVIMREGRDGIVDKYIGDAVMAFFGAPEQHEDDALRAVLAALEMQDALKDFNGWQAVRGRSPFQVGIGISFGLVTVGNIGSERKMDYTVIGDQVNLASRLEGLTKKYREPVVISAAVQEQVKEALRCRHLDTVAVKGRSEGSGIYSVRGTLTPQEEQAWPLHEQALAAYYRREFAEAASLFRRVREILPGDYCADLFLRRCAVYELEPPTEAWDGVEEMTEK